MRRAAIVLSAIVFLVGVKLIDWEGLGELWRLQCNEFVIALATTLADVLSLIEQVCHTYRRRTCLWTPRPDGTGLHKISVAPGVLAALGILSNHFSQEVLAVASQPDAGIQGLVVDAWGIDDVDYLVAKAMLNLRDLLVRRGTRLSLATNSSAFYTPVAEGKAGERRR